MTVFNPSLPPYRVTSTSVFASGALSCQPAVSRISLRVNAPAPPASAAPAVTPEAIRNLRRVTVSTSTSSADRVLGAGQPERDQPVRVRDGGQHGAGTGGEGVDHQKPGQRIGALTGRRLGQLVQ